MENQTETSKNSELILNKEFIEAVEKSKLQTADKRNVLLTKIGVKPASFITMPIKLRLLEREGQPEHIYFKNEEIDEIKKLVENSGLKYYYQYNNQH